MENPVAGLSFQLATMLCLPATAEAIVNNYFHQGPPRSGGKGQFTPKSKTHAVFWFELLRSGTMKNLPTSLSRNQDPSCCEQFHEGTILFLPNYTHQPHLCTEGSVHLFMDERLCRYGQSTPQSKRDNSFGVSCRVFERLTVEMSAFSPL